LRSLRQRYPDVPTLALAAAALLIASVKTLSNSWLWRNSIHIPASRLISTTKSSPSRSRAIPNCCLIRAEGSGNVCLSRRRVDEITFKLQQDGVSALPYHAGLSDEERAAIKLVSFGMMFK